MLGYLLLFRLSGGFTEKDYSSELGAGITGCVQKPEENHHDPKDVGTERRRRLPYVVCFRDGGETRGLDLEERQGK